MKDTTEAWIVTGACAAGKTTVGRLLAERLGLSFVEGDAIRPPGAGPSEERYQRLAAAAPGAVVEDVVIGSWLAWLATRVGPCRIVVLAPPADVLARRNAGRSKDGYGSYSIGEIDRALREQTARIGLWLDTADQTPEETVAEILARAEEARV